jgi:hypothetical protein
VSVPVTSPAAVGSVRSDPVRALQHTLYRAAKADPTVPAKSHFSSL